MKIAPNFYRVDEIADGDDDFKIKIINILKKEFPVERNDFENSFKNEKYNKCAELIHKMKHKVNLLGLDEAYVLASQFESDLKNNKIDLDKEFFVILDAIEEFLKKV